MKLLVVLGAGASYQCWPPERGGTLSLPLANGLYSTDQTQDELLNVYDLTGLAAKIRRKAQLAGKEFDIEAELAGIKERAEKAGDFNVLKSLLKSRFYIQELVQKLSEETIRATNGHTLYVDFLNDLKDWIDGNPSGRSVDIVTFNYDTLIDKAMSTVYSHDWRVKNNESPLSAYYLGQNLRIYKPHGSINWGRTITRNGLDSYVYSDFNQASNDFNTIEISDKFNFVDLVYRNGERKDYLPAIAIPFKGKSFDECPIPMRKKMLDVVASAESILTIGWRGGDEHFLEELRKNTDARDVAVVSPDALGGELGVLLQNKLVSPKNMTFADFIYTGELTKLLKKLELPRAFA
jgi:hypothetical protein